MMINNSARNKSAVDVDLVEATLNELGGHSKFLLITTTLRSVARADTTSSSILVNS